MSGTGSGNRDHRDDPTTIMIIRAPGRLRAVTDTAVLAAMAAVLAAAAATVTVWTPDAVQRR